MATIIEEFDAMRVGQVALQWKDETAVSVFKCIGSISGETEMKEITKQCGGRVGKSKSYPIKHNLTLAAHIPVKDVRKITGLSNTGLKAGVYSYGLKSKAAELTLTADVIDDFEDVTKLVAFPECVSPTGLKVFVDGDADEVAYLELEFTATPDEDGDLYYEAFVDEVDQAIKDGWHSAFKRSLVADIEA